MTYKLYASLTSSFLKIKLFNQFIWIKKIFFIIGYHEFVVDSNNLSKLCPPPQYFRSRHLVVPLPVMQFWFEIPAVRLSDVAAIGRARFAPTKCTETAPSAQCRSGDGNKIQLLEGLMVRHFGIYSAPVWIAKCLERVNAIPVVQIIPAIPNDSD